MKVGHFYTSSWTHCTWKISLAPYVSWPVGYIFLNLLTFWLFSVAWSQVIDRGPIAKDKHQWKVGHQQNVKIDSGFLLVFTSFQVS